MKDLWKFNLISFIFNFMFILILTHKEKSKFADRVGDMCAKNVKKKFNSKILTVL